MRKTGNYRPEPVLALATGATRRVRGYSCGTTLRSALDGQAVNRALRSRGVKFRVAEFVSQPVSLGLAEGRDDVLDSLHVSILARRTHQGTTSRTPDLTTDGPPPPGDTLPPDPFKARLSGVGVG